MSTTLEATVTVKKEWESFPFSYLGRSYNSKVSTTGHHYAVIKSLTAGVFNTMNQNCLRDISTITASSTVEEITAELERLNAGSSWAVIELAGE
jgi:hypothetical protein